MSPEVVDYVAILKEWMAKRGMSIGKLAVAASSVESNAGIPDVSISKPYLSKILARQAPPPRDRWLNLAFSNVLGLDDERLELAAEVEWMRKNAPASFPLFSSLARTLLGLCDEIERRNPDLISEAKDLHDAVAFFGDELRVSDYAYRYANILIPDIQESAAAVRRVMGQEATVEGAFLMIQQLTGADPTLVRSYVSMMVELLRLSAQNAASPSGKVLVTSAIHNKTYNIKYIDRSGGIRSRSVRARRAL